MILKDKVAVIYGAGGAVGGAIARALRDRGGQSLPHRPHAGTSGGRRQGDHFRRRIRRGGGGRHPRRRGSRHPSPDRDRQGGPRRHLVQRRRRPEPRPGDRALRCGDPGGPARRAGCRAPRPADHDQRHVVLPHRSAGRTTHDPERIGGDHDRHHAPLADGLPDGGRLRTGASRQGGAHPTAVRRARAPWHSRGRPTTARHAPDGHAQGRLRGSRQGRGDVLGAVPGVARQPGPTRSDS